MNARCSWSPRSSASVPSDLRTRGQRSLVTDDERFSEIPERALLVYHRWEVQCVYVNRAVENLAE